MILQRYFCWDPTTNYFQDQCPINLRNYTLLLLNLSGDTIVYHYHNNADIAFTCLWILLNISGVTVQLILYLTQKKRFRKKQIRNLHVADPLSSIPTTHLRRYPGFPPRSLYCQLVNRLSNKGQYRPPPGTHQAHRSRVGKARTANESQSRPLLSPDSSLNAHGNTRYYGTQNSNIIILTLFSLMNYNNDSELISK